MMARDRGFSPPLARQILIYPMLDDRTETDHTGGRDVFTIVDRITSWASYLGDLHRSDKVPTYAAAVRISEADVKGFPPLYIDVGQLGNFLSGVLAYVQKFVKAGVPGEFHLYEGVPHAFHIFAPTSKVACRAFENKSNAMLSIQAVQILANGAGIMLSLIAMQIAFHCGVKALDLKPGQ